MQSCHEKRSVATLASSSMKNTNGPGSALVIQTRDTRPATNVLPDNYNMNNRTGQQLLDTNGHAGYKQNGNAAEINGNSVVPWKPGDDLEKFEIPLPFGYHMDLDFLRLCSGEAVSGETLHRLKDLRKQRRKQRKTLEALMGIRQEQREQERRNLMSTSLTSSTSSTGRRLSPAKDSKRSSPAKLSFPQPPPDVVNTPEFIQDALRDAVQDFEQCLERSKEEEKGLSSFDLLNVSGLKSTSTPNKVLCSKFNTFPRAISSPDENVTSTFKLFRQSSNSSLSSVSTSSSAFPYPHYHNHHKSHSPDAVLAGLPSSVPPKSDRMETDSITSITSEMSTHTLKNIREQMARSLHKLKEYEKQVEAIPVMQVKLSVLKEEKRLLMLKLKQREMELRRDRNEPAEPDESDAGTLLDYDTEDEDPEDKIGRQRSAYLDAAASAGRARSESPYGRGALFNPEEFISVRRKRSASCGYNSDSDLVAPMSERRYLEPELDPKYRFNMHSTHQNLSTLERSEMNVFTSGRKKPQMQLATVKVVEVEKKRAPMKEAAVNTDPPVEVKKEKKPPPPPPVRKSDRACNTDPPPKSPPPPRKVNHGTNTSRNRTFAKGVGTLLQMDHLFTKEELENRVQEAVFKTEEEIMGCPLLQKAMAKVEEEAIHGPQQPVETFEMACQVGEENLTPFTISVALQCKLDEVRPLVYECACQAAEPPKTTTDGECQSGGSMERRSRSLDPEVERLVRTIGVGDCKVIEEPPDPLRFRDMGVCTEKWVEVIKASKQTDTEDFAFKDTESPRVADMVLEQSPERVVWEKRSSLRRTSAGSPSLSRKSSVNSPGPSRRSSTLSQKERGLRNQGTMTYEEVKVKVLTKDAKTGSSAPPPPPPVKTKSVGTSAMMLPLNNKNLPAPGSPLTTPELEKPPVKFNLCDKCNLDIQKVAEGILVGPGASPPSPKFAPPSPDMPWLSKIPRPVPENPDVYKLKAATSTGNLLAVGNNNYANRPHSPLQRSKSNLTPTLGRKSVLSPSSRNAVTGTPPPHPSTPPVGSKRVPSPLARSQSPYAAQKSLIPKLSPGTSRKQPSLPEEPQEPAAEQSKIKSLIPRVQTPPALRKMYPGTDKLASPDRKVVRKNTFSKVSPGLSNPELEKQEKKSKLDMVRRKFSDIKEKLSGSESEDEKPVDKGPAATAPITPHASQYPLPGAALFAPIDENRRKAEPSKEMKAALKVLNDSFGRSVRGNAQVTNAVNIIQQEWFKTSSTKQSNPLDVEDYLDAIEAMSRELLDRVVNLTDVNGNTALHYSVSHGNFDVVSVLLDSKVARSNVLNKAGYTCIMLISLAQIQNKTHRAVVERLFLLGDVNVRGAQHGQTALMLAVSHGRADMVELLAEAGADVNIKDEDGSTALMCAAEHGHMEIVKYLLQQPETNVLAKDNDGLTALAVAMEAGHRDVGVILYANMSFSRGASPYSSMRVKKSGIPSLSRTTTPTGSVKSLSTGTGRTPPQRSPVVPTPPLRTQRRNSLNP